MILNTKQYNTYNMLNFIHVHVHVHVHAFDYFGIFAVHYKMLTKMLSNDICLKCQKKSRVYRILNLVAGMPLSFRVATDKD